MRRQLAFTLDIANVSLHSNRIALKSRVTYKWRQPLAAALKLSNQVAVSHQFAFNCDNAKMSLHISLSRENGIPVARGDLGASAIDTSQFVSHDSNSKQAHGNDIATKLAVLG